MERGHEGVDDTRIEIRPRALQDDVLRIERRHGLAVRPIARQRVVHIGHRDDARLERNLLAACGVIAGTVELVVVGKHDRNDATQRSSDGLEHRHALVDVPLHLGVLGRRELGSLVEQLAADVELADVVKQARRAHVLDAFGVEAEVGGDARRIHRHPVRVVLGVLVFRDEVAQEPQDTVVGLTQLAELMVLVLVHRAHQITGHDEHAAPRREVEPRRGRQRAAGPAEEARGRRQEHDHQHAAERGQRGMPSTVEIGRSDRRHHVEAEHHPLRIDQEVQEQRDDEHREDEPQLFVHLLEMAHAVDRHCILL